VRLDDSIEAAAPSACASSRSRGSMSVGAVAGRPAAGRVVETEDFILRDTQRLIEAWHDAAPRRDDAGGGGAVLAVLGQRAT
jgi:8-oxoguanine deaminase